MQKEYKVRTKGNQFTNQKYYPDDIFFVCTAMDFIKKSNKGDQVLQRYKIQLC